MKTYKERLEEYLGPVSEGETRVYVPSSDDILTLDDVLASIREALKTNFSVTLWTYERSNKEIVELHEVLSEHGIIHYWDEIMDAFNCFKSSDDMDMFLKEIGKKDN